jgi:spore coat polysaccharide biosynthesis predicted glycosyltransferase SpsG
VNGCEAAFLFDEGPGIGLGHRRRCEALAAEVQRLGWTARLVPLAGANRIRASIVVVDSYVARADEMELDAGLLVAIDDLQRDLDVDVLIDPSPGAIPDVHRNAHVVLAGAPFALVGALSHELRPCGVGSAVKRVLVTTGAADSKGAGARIAERLVGAVPGVDVRLVVGPWGRHEAPSYVSILHAPPSLADEMAATPLVVTAGGVSMLEACRMGRAVVALVLAENQRVAVESLAAEQAVVAATEADVGAVVSALCHDTAARRALGKRAIAVIDGEGAARVAAELIAQAAVVRTAF